MQAQQAERTIPEVSDNYLGFCCTGFDYLICLIFPDTNIGRTEIWGSCQNPNCPNYSQAQGPADPYRGVNSCDLDDFEATLEEKGVKVAA